jgi:hypothetical protein
MDYYVYRDNNGMWQLIGTARYIEGAEKLLSDWHCGYIACNGDIIQTKNMPTH